MEKYNVSYVKKREINMYLNDNDFDFTRFVIECSKSYTVSSKKLKDIYKKYGTKVKITFLFDKWNLLEYKDSPIDKGKDIFQELFKRRISL